MLAIFLACLFLLGGEAAQAQANSGAQSATDPSQMSLAERAAAARKARVDDPSQMSLAERAAATRKADKDDSSQMSLADRAAAARKAAAEGASHGETLRPGSVPSLTSEQRGTVRGNAYVNDFLHFRVALNQWQPLSAERMARAEDAGRRLINPEGPTSSPYRVLWIGDNVGRNIALSVMPLPPDAPIDLKQINEKMKKIAIGQLALASEVTESEEPFLLGDATHPFAGFRINSTIHGRQIVQSSQVTMVKGFLMSFTVTGDSDQDVSDAVRSLKANLGWTATR